MFGALGYQPIEHPLDIAGPKGLDLFEATTPTSERRPRALANIVPGIDPNQFTLFQLSTADGTPPVLDLHAATPTLKGSDEKPDVRVTVDLLSFRISPSENVDPSMQATLRLDMGKDRSSPSPADPLFWSLAAGIDLAAQAVKPQEAKSMTADFSHAFKKRPIEIPGGLAQMRVEVVAHEEPPWWRKIFSFADSSSVRKLVSAIGFPGIALDAVQLLDTMLAKVSEAKAKPIFQSRPLVVALSERAATDYTAGLSSVSAAVLNNGVFLLLRHKDAPILAAEPPLYLAGYGRLVPKKGWNSAAPTLPQQDPYDNLSYAVLRVRTREIAMDTGV
jgi:hypothetical protein